MQAEVRDALQHGGGESLVPAPDPLLFSDTTQGGEDAVVGGVGAHQSGAHDIEGEAGDGGHTPADAPGEGFHQETALLDPGEVPDAELHGVVDKELDAGVGEAVDDHGEVAAEEAPGTFFLPQGADGGEDLLGGVVELHHDDDTGERGEGAFGRAVANATGEEVHERGVFFFGGGGWWLSWRERESGCEREERRIKMGLKSGVVWIRRHIV